MYAFSGIRSIERAWRVEAPFNRRVIRLWYKFDRWLTNWLAGILAAYVLAKTDDSVWLAGVPALIIEWMNWLIGFPVFLFYFKRSGLWCPIMTSNFILFFLILVKAGVRGEGVQELLQRVVGPRPQSTGKKTLLSKLMLKSSYLFDKEVREINKMVRTFQVLATNSW